MGEFFKPRRRKLGVLTLVMACVSAAGWVRSLTMHDEIQISHHERHQSIFNSRAGTIDWLTVEWHNTFLPPGSFEWSSKRIDHRGPTVLWFKKVKGSMINNGKVLASTTTGTSFPYWSVTFPLTLLSAYLLLSKPRPDTVVQRRPINRTYRNEPSFP